MNTTKDKIELKEGTIISNLQPVAVMNDVSLPEKIVKSGKLSNSSEDSVPQFLHKLIEEIDDSIPQSTVLAVRQLLMEYLDVFSESEFDLGKTKIIEHPIDTGDAKSFRQPLRRFPTAHLEAISEHVDSMLAQEVIEPACRPYASNVVLVWKRDNTYTCCVEYRKLNSDTRMDAYPLPRIEYVS